jgi:hypothetical protein
VRLAGVMLAVGAASARVVRLAPGWCRLVGHRRWLLAGPRQGCGAISPANVATPVPGAINGDLPARDPINVARTCPAYSPAAPNLASW